MLHIISLIRLRATACISLLIGMTLLAGCAQDRPTGYFDTPHDSTLADAEQQAQGRRGTRAPSQLQFGFGETGERDTRSQAQAGASGTVDTDAKDLTKVRALMEAKTFLGTVPCVTQGADCPASRVTLTLAPSGEWRARTILLGAPGAERPIIEHGCWDVVGTDPLRIVLLTDDKTSRANFTFVNDNVLRVNMYNDVRPMLDYHLTRQPDIDPIDELAGQAPLICD